MGAEAGAAAQEVSLISGSSHLIFQLLCSVFFDRLLAWHLVCLFSSRFLVKFMSGFASAIRHVIIYMR